MINWRIHFTRIKKEIKIKWNVLATCKERRANPRDPGRYSQGQLLDHRQPLCSLRCAETRPPPTQRHGSGIIGKTSPPIQDEPTPPVFVLHLDAAEKNGASESRTGSQGTLIFSSITPPLPGSPF
ncbi:hypothetical protein Hanom_Chr15g01350091 [Helianthus anomalus]